MKTSTEILFLLSAAGTLNGLILAIYLFYSRKNKSISNLFLALLLLMLSIRIGKSVFLYFSVCLLEIYLQIGLSACFFIGPSLYCYTRASFTHFERIPRSWLAMYGVFLLVVVAGGAAFPYQHHPEAWMKVVIPYIIYGQWLIFQMMSLFVLWKNRQLAKTKPLVTSVVTGNLFIFLAYILAILNWIPGSYILGAIMYSFILYISLFMVINKGKLVKPEETDKYQNKKIADKDALPVIRRLENTIEAANLYRDPELKLNNLAQKLNIPPHQLSQVLNDNLGKSFSTFINEYRINEAAERIIHEPHIKIEEIGYEVGFNSKSAFFSAFKKIKNTTPLKYRESLADSSQSPDL